METAIIDYGMGNLLSVQRAFQKCGSDAVILDDPGELGSAEHIVLPGVGAFPDAMENLKRGAWLEALDAAVLKKGTPLLGICLGMQLLADRGYEVRECAGLAYIPGKIVRFAQTECGERIPHVGWNEIALRAVSPLFEGIADGTDYYFVHSYHFEAACGENIAAVTPYCGEFVSSVVRENIVGTQFHPEKSQKAGFKLIRNFLAM